MRPVKQIVGHWERKRKSEKEVAGQSDPLLKVTDFRTFASKETEEHSSWCLWCCGRERTREREGGREGW